MKIKLLMTCGITST